MLSADPFPETLSVLAGIGDPQRPENASPEDLGEWWLSNALAEYESRGLLSPANLAEFRIWTWQLVRGSATMVASAQKALASHQVPDLIRGAAVIGSIARAEATDESDVDWNMLLDDLALRQAQPSNAMPRLIANTSLAYCVELGARDLLMRDLVDFDGLIASLVASSGGVYRPLPHRTERGAAGERLRAFAERELNRPFPDFPRTGLAAPVLAASYGLSWTDAESVAWDTLRISLRRRVIPEVLALAWISLTGVKLHRLAGMTGTDRTARHAAHGLLSAVSQALLVLQDGRTEVIVPYWRAPLLLSGFPPEIPILLTVAAYQVVSCRVNREPPGPDVLERVVDITDRALEVAKTRHWLSEENVEQARQVLRFGETGSVLPSLFCR